MAGFGRDDFFQWVADRFQELREEGPLTAIVIEHFNGAGERREATSLTNKQLPEDKWNADHVGETLWRASNKFAQGMPGVQQLQATAIYGAPGPGKTVKEVCQPFQLTGNLTQGGLQLGGGLSSESPGPLGTLATATRWGELAIQGANQKDLAVTQLMAQMIKELRDDYRREHIESRELWIAVQKLVMEQNQQMAANMVRGLQLQMGQQVISLLPGFVNMMTGKDLFPVSQVDASLADVMVSSLTPEEQQVLLASIQARPNSGPLVAVLSDQLSKARARKDAIAAEANKQLAAAPGRPDLGELDAMGTAYRALKTGMAPPEPPKHALPAAVYEAIDKAGSGNESNGANGMNNNGNGHVEPAKPVDTEDTQLWEDFFKRAGPNAEMMIKMAEGQDPEFGARLRARYNSRKT